MHSSVSRERAANGEQVLSGCFWRNGAAGSEQEEPAARQFQSLLNFLAHLFGRAILEHGFLTDSAHYGFVGAQFALAQIRIAFQRGSPVDGLNRIGLKKIEVDVRAAIVQDVELAPALDGVQELQVVLLAKLTILVGG